MNEYSNTHRFRWFAIGTSAMFALVKWSKGVAQRAGVYKEYSEDDKQKIKNQVKKEWRLK